MSTFDIAEVDRLLTTTKQVRKRLDLGRPVPRELLLDCVDIASHAPMGGNIQANRWIVIDESGLKDAIAGHYRDVGYDYLDREMAGVDDPRQMRIADSARYLCDHIHEVPALVMALRLGVVAGDSRGETAAFFGSVAPGVWSFQLAARARGLGSAWTTFTTDRRSEMGELLGIPDTVTQVALLPVGYFTGESFVAAPRRPASEITYFNRWKQFD